MNKVDKRENVSYTPENYPEFRNSGAVWRILMYICVMLVALFVGTIVIMMRVFGDYDGGIILLCVSGLFFLTGIAGTAVYCSEHLIYRNGKLTRRSVTGSASIDMSDVKFCYASTEKDLFGRNLRICFLDSARNEIARFSDDGSAAGNVRFMGLLKAYGVKILNDKEYIAIREKEIRSGMADKDSK